MTQADCVLSTPPTNTPIDTTRRRFFTVAAGASVATVGTLTAAVAVPIPPPDAELIELGARFEPLVDRYYIARRRWAAALTQAHAEHEAEFGAPDIRDFERRHEIRKAFEDSCERSGASTTGEALHAIFKEMAPLAAAINAASVTSIEGFRAKALVAFWEVAPLGAGDSEFTFDDAWPFQQLFTAVAELCGLKDKMVATGYALPDIGMVEAAPDDDSDDEEVQS
jgi:hypothetical protein